VATPRNGHHYLFRRPKELGETKGKIAPAIDIRDRAYVIAAGSVMSNGPRYSLQNGSIELLAAAIGSATLPELPDWLSALVAKPTPGKNTATGYAAPPRFTPAGDVRRRLTGLVRAVALAPPGERNAMLHWGACRVGELVQAGLITEEAAFAMFVEAGSSAGLSTRETIATVKSGVAKGSGSAHHGR
jgi:hypothetical protein